MEHHSPKQFHIHRHPSRRHDVDMTQGNVVKHLILFALPLLMGNLFQQLYNTVDTWVVGNYVSNEAFSAVGTVGTIINMLIGTFMGLSNGAGVVISQYYGARQYDKVRDAVHTSILMTLILGITFTALGISMIPFMLNLMNMPVDVIPEATAYLTIYFSGILGLMLYNMGSGILRAVGDSRRPFYFLVAAALLNVALDLIFVIAFHMGVEGVAYATILSQGLSAFLTFLTLYRTDSCVQFRPRNLRLHLSLLRSIIGVGIPAALQVAITSFSNVFVQSYINYFSTDCMSGWTAYSKIDQLIILPMQSISMAATTFVGQNLGKNQVDRAKKGSHIACLLSLSITGIMLLVVVPTAPYLVWFLNQKPEVVEYGTLFLRHIAPCFLICCPNQVYASALRGAGNSRTPMLAMLFSFVFFRQAYLFVMANYISNTVLPIAMGYPAGWVVCTTIIVVYFFRTDLSKNRIIKEPA